MAFIHLVYPCSPAMGVAQAVKRRVVIRRKVTKELIMIF
jgi:hypothetical protein